MFDKPQISYKDRVSLKSYNLKLKSTITWLESMEYTSAINSTENVTKAVKRLPPELRQAFFTNHRVTLSILTVSQLDLKVFSSWLDKSCSSFSTQLPTSWLMLKRNPTNFRSSSKYQRDIIKPSSYNTSVREGPKPINYLCSESHPIMDCQKLSNLNVTQRKKPSSNIDFALTA